MHQVSISLIITYNFNIWVKLFEFFKFSIDIDVCDIWISIPIDNNQVIWVQGNIVVVRYMLLIVI